MKWFVWFEALIGLNNQMGRIISSDKDKQVALIVDYLL